MMDSKDYDALPWYGRRAVDLIKITGAVFMGGMMLFIMAFMAIVASPFLLLDWIRGK